MLTSFLLAILFETRKSLLIVWDYKFNVLTGFVIKVLIFVATNFFLGSGRIDPGQLPVTLLGYIMWCYAATVLVEMGMRVNEEAQAGTLEQLYMSPFSSGLLLVGRVCAALVMETLNMLVIVISLVLLMGIHLPLRWQSLPVLALTMMGLSGFGFVISGLALVFKRIDSVVYAAQPVLIFLSGAWIPVDRLPSWLEVIAKALPTTQGIIVLRNVSLSGQSLSSAWIDGSLVWLTLHSAFLLAGGWLAFKVCERVARRQGTLGQY